MRLFEVDQGSARDVLAVLQGLANKQGQSSELPFPVVMNVLRPFALGINTPDGLIALKNKVDPAGDVIADVLDNGTVVLKTNKESNAQDKPMDQPKGSSIDQMAKSGSKKLTPDI
jgi:hypothetical protein